MISGEPHAIVRITYTWALGFDWLSLQERWPTEEVDVMVDMGTYAHLTVRVAS